LIDSSDQKSSITGQKRDCLFPDLQTPELPVSPIGETGKEQQPVNQRYKPACNFSMLAFIGVKDESKKVFALYTRENGV
jgi:hypothetical protein